MIKNVNDSNELTTHLARHAYISLLLKLIFHFHILKAAPWRLDNDLNAIAPEAVGVHPSFAGTAADHPGHPVPLEHVLGHNELAVLEQHEAVAFVLPDAVVFEVDDRGYGEQAVVVVVDVVFGD